MADVARLAGVSTSTVSRALRQPDIVSPELRTRIDEAIERLAYVPNLMAGGLASARSRTVGIIVPSIMNSFFSETVEALGERLADRGYQLMLGHSGYSTEREEALVASYLAWSPAAIVLTGRHHSKLTLRRLLEAEIPVVEMWELGERPIDMLVGFSHREVGRAVARHFRSRGATRLAFVGAALDRDLRALERGAGFLAEASAGGTDAVTVSLAERPQVATGAQGLARLLDEQPGVDAAFFSNDVMALGALFECRRRGIAVPERLRLCGFGDLDFAAESVPLLTTVRPPRREIGRRIADALLARFEGDASGPAVLDLGFELIERESG
ncbi:LacI family DNA-binding transcriptional regulator [Salinarimonas soli]|uniref:LacI family DNA-binding transcriptional regulator n=2 Tax=Salinarimonas soli TaxID=1638099 RepID=A0A5B2VHY6_9HYPH|nr:LacI family DNA-binding transcriptional regulator [Salinarimonas soli]